MRKCQKMHTMLNYGFRKTQNRTTCKAKILKTFRCAKNFFELKPKKPSICSKQDE